MRILADDDVGVNDRKNLDGVGIITVELFRASGTLPTVYETPRANGTSYSPLKVDEKALKGCTKSHSTRSVYLTPHLQLLLTR